MSISIGPEEGATGRAHIEAMLSRYPNVADEETAILIRWFRSEASALDVGLIASDHLLVGPYRQFKADHLDGFNAADIVRALIFISIFGGVILLIICAAL